MHLVNDKLELQNLNLNIKPDLQLDLSRKIEPEPALFAVLWKLQFSLGCCFDHTYVTEEIFA